MKAVAASLQAQTLQPRADRENLEVIPCHGRRIVELTELGKNLRCCKCFKVLSLENIVKETRLGLISCLTVSCESCCVNTSVLTGKMHTSKNDAKLSDVNTKIILGAVHAGIGSTALTKLLDGLNIPPITDNLFKRYEREVGPVIEECAKESCQRAAEKERKLVIENVEKLCDEM
ncbi:uncharacterized protein [Venturia canescens]|uniref:uncharacterized protein n=1 Tax=Venturia canescens TaxID=32260 RepID=UPI001C9CBADA|nr:uncharacterized protein LOC122407534 [Venturia canescens]